MITAAGKREKGVLGVDDTLLGLQEGRVWQLIYADGFVTAGAQCANCGALLAKDNGPCAYCDSPVRVIEDLIGLAAERVLETEGKVEEVRGAAAKRLHEVGSVGALLRF